MFSGTDIFQAAKHLFDHRGGDDAERIASARVSSLRDQGDTNGEETWSLITAMIRELGRTERQPGESLH